jgi:glycerol-3-phosphate dehydrogenase (NAD(P)+)
MTAAPTVAVIGAGNWGTTLAHLVARNGHPTRLWTREPAQRDELNGRHSNEKAITGLTVDARVSATCEATEALDGATLVLMAIPSQAFRQVCRTLAPIIQPEQLVIHGTKGLEQHTHLRMSEILQAETCVRQLGVLAGPNIAAEVSQGKPAGTVVASRFPAVIAAGRAALSCPQLMVFAGRDVLGTELAGALKNVIAIAAGMVDEMGMGDNAKAFLVTRGMSELMRLCAAMGAEPWTLAGLAGIGDLIVTCASPLSRNHRLGVALARGQTLQAALTSIGMVAEGVFACRSARALARAHGLELPVFERVDRILHEGLAPGEALAEIMRLPAGRDVPSFAPASGGRSPGPTGR